MYLIPNAIGSFIIGVSPIGPEQQGSTMQITTTPWMAIITLVASPASIAASTALAGGQILQALALSDGSDLTALFGPYIPADGFVFQSGTPDAGKVGTQALILGIKSTIVQTVP